MARKGITYEDYTPQERADLLHRLIESRTLQDFLAAITQKLLSKIKIDGIQFYIECENPDGFICEYLKLPDEFKGLEIVSFQSRIPLSTDDITTRTSYARSIVSIKHDEKEEHSDSIRSRFIGWKLHEMNGIPLIKDDHCFGVIILLHQSSSFTPDMLAFANDFLNELTSAIFVKKEQNRLFENAAEAERIVKRSRKISGIIQGTNTRLPKAEIIHTILSQLIQTYNFTLGAIALKKNNELYTTEVICNEAELEPEIENYRQWQISNPVEITSSGGVIGACAYYGNQIFIPDINEIMHLPMADYDQDSISRLPRPRTFLAVPIKCNDELFGVIYLAKLYRKAIVREDDIETLMAVASFIGLAIESSDNFYATQKPDDH